MTRGQKNGADNPLYKEIDRLRAMMETLERDLPLVLLFLDKHHKKFLKHLRANDISGIEPEIIISSLEKIAKGKQPQRYNDFKEEAETIILEAEAETGKKFNASQQKAVLEIVIKELFKRHKEADNGQQDRA